MDYFRSTFTDEQSLRADGENRAEWIMRVVTEVRRCDCWVPRAALRGEAQRSSI